MTLAACEHGFQKSQSVGGSAENSTVLAESENSESNNSQTPNLDQNSDSLNSDEDIENSDSLSGSESDENTSQAPKVPVSLFVLECVPLAENLFMRVENQFYENGTTRFRRIYYSSPERANPCVNNSELLPGTFTKELYSIESLSNLELNKEFAYDTIIETSNFLEYLSVTPLSLEGIDYLNQNLDDEDLNPCDPAFSGTPRPPTEVYAGNANAYYGFVGRSYNQSCRGKDIYQIMSVTESQPRLLKTGRCTGNPNCYLTPENRPVELWHEQYWQKEVLAQKSLRTLNIYSYEDPQTPTVRISYQHVEKMEAPELCDEFIGENNFVSPICFWNGENLDFQGQIKPFYIVSQDVEVDLSGAGSRKTYREVSIEEGPTYLSRQMAIERCNSFVAQADLENDHFYCKWGEQILDYYGHIRVSVRAKWKCSTTVNPRKQEGDLACISVDSFGDIFHHRHYSPVSSIMENRICESGQAVAAINVSIEEATQEELNLIASDLELPPRLLLNNVDRLVRYTCSSDQQAE